MALTPRSGFSSTPSDPNDTVDSATTTSDIIPTMPYVSDGALNKYAIDTTQYANATKSLIGFMKGKRVTVTYYRLLRGEGQNNRTNIADLPTARNVTDTEYQKILNLEITLPKAFDFNADTTAANMSIKGQAMMYPFMNPNVGDLFMMGIGDGQIGLCRVSSVIATTWRADRIYVIEFIVQNFVDSSLQDPIEGSVTLVSVFDKQNYLGGTGALLSEQTYLQLNKIKILRTTLCRYYHQQFFDTSINSFIRPDGIYDPWVVQFMANKITMSDVPVRAKNLLGQSPKLYQQTLWARLEDRYNTSLYMLSAYAELRGYSETRMGTFITELYGRQIIFPGTSADSGTPYLYTSNFYTSQPSLMTPEELLIYTAITLRSAGDLTSFIALYLDTLYSLSVDDQFYKIPLYIHLIDMCLQSQYREIDAPSMNFVSSGDNQE